MTDKAPDAFRTISEVADELDLPQHVLRFWETKFSHIRPTKRSSGRRFYRPEDVALLRSIRDMLYGQGYTIRGVQRLLKERGKSPATEELPSASEAVLPVDTGLSHTDDDDDRTDETSDVELSLPVRDALQAVRDELRACAQVLAEARRSRL